MSPDEQKTFTALSLALDDEYKARATYRAILARFGDIRPFSNIVEAEERHVQALLSLFARRGWTPLADPYIGQIDVPESVHDACAAGVEAEVENDALYDRIMPMTTDADVLRVFENLRRASAENHLPAFQRCVQRDGKSRGGHGAERGHGHAQERGQGRGRGHGQDHGLGQGRGHGLGQVRRRLRQRGLAHA